MSNLCFCGAPVAPGRSKYCSEEHARMAHNGNIVNVEQNGYTCEVCGVELTGRRYRFCSHKCTYTYANRNAPERTSQARTKTLDEEHDRELDLQLQRKVFGHTLQELVADRSLSTGVRVSRQKQGDWRRMIRERLGNWRRDRAS